MTKLLADIRAGKVKAVACWRLDRLGRTAKGLTALFDELVMLKVNFVSLKDGIDLSTAAGRLIANVLASVSAYETEIRNSPSELEAKKPWCGFPDLGFHVAYAGSFLDEGGCKMRRREILAWHRRS